MANDHLNMFAGNADGAVFDCRPAPVCDPRPVCHACGGLECLCRPRFFAGQLLSDEDLNRLDHYIVAKNRLHNRHLFGTGVVCGLEVVCSACDPAGNASVVVKPGYALSPCGNDIVVCAPHSVNVCELIDQCRPKGDACFEPDRGNDDCDNGTEDWVLAICYQEKPSRGVTAMRGGSCGCGCGGGGKSGGGCSCGGGHSHGASTSSGGAHSGEASCGCGGGTSARTAKTRSAAKPGPRPAQCEPTLTCEGYTFAVYKISEGRSGNDNKPRDPGALITRFFCCLQPLLAQLQEFPPGNATQPKLKAWLQGFLDAMRQFLLTEGLYDCDVTARLNAVPMPAPGGDNQLYLAAWKASAIQIFEILAAVFLKCLCSALLPPCPPPAMNDCVPIATVTVSRGRCRVRHVCNISNRRFLITWPALQYWFSWLPLFTSWLPGSDTLRSLIDRLCCTPIAELLGITNEIDFKAGQAPQAPGRGVQPVPAGQPAFVAQPMVAGPQNHMPFDKAGLHPFTELLAESLLGGREANAATLLLAAMGARQKDGSPLVSDAALKYPGQAMLMHQVIGPALAPLLPLGGGLFTGGADVGSLSRSIEALQKKVEEQDAAIKKLRQRRPTP